MWFDVIIGTFDVIEHIKEDERVLSHIYKAVAPGVCMLTVPQHCWLWSPMDELSYHKRRYTCRELSEKVKQAGFSVVFQTSFVTFLLPLVLIKRLYRRFSFAEFDIINEFRINPIVNFVFEKVMKMELMFIKSRLSMSVGSSQLLIAKK